MKLETFANDKYFLLKYLFEHQIDYNGEKIIKTDMQTLADELHIRKMKVVALIKECCEDGFLIRYTPKGKYQLTDKSYKLISIFTETAL